MVSSNNNDACVIKSITDDGSSTITIGGLNGILAASIKRVDMQLTISSIPHQIFQAFPVLETLQLFNTGINVITPGTFEYASSLKSLQIHSGNIKNLEAFSFKGLKKMEKLGIWTCGIEHIDVAAFSGLTQLKDLNLFDNLISSIAPGTFSDSVNLEQISLSFNKLQRIDDGIFYFPKLTGLNLQGNQIIMIDSSFLDHLPSIRSLSMKYNLCVNENFWIESARDLENVRNVLRSCFENFDTTETPETSSSPTTFTESNITTELPETTIELQTTRETTVVTEPETTAVTKETTETSVVPTSTFPPNHVLITCQFSYGADNKYECLMDGIVMEDRTKIVFIGGHLPGKTNDDCRVVRIFRSRVISTVVAPFNNLDLLAINQGTIFTMV